MAERENQSRRSVVFIVTCVLHGAIIFVLIHVKTEDKSRKATDEPLTIFLVKPQPAVAIALPKQYMIERRSRKRQERGLDSETPLPDISVPLADSQTAEEPANIDWTGEAQRSADDIASRTAPGSSTASVATAGSAPWDPHLKRLETTPEGVKLHIAGTCFALLHNWTHDPLLGTKGELQVNCSWKKPPPRGDLFESIRRPPPSNQ